MGNDFINLKLSYSQLSINGKVRPFFELSYLEDGANGLDTPFSNPYEDHNGIVVDFIPPKHPTRPIIKNYEIDFGVETNIHLQTFLTLSFQLGSHSTNNIDNYGIKIRFWSYLDLNNISRLSN